MKKTIIYVLMLILLSSFITSISVTDERLILYWPFNEDGSDSTIIDQSPRNRWNGSCSGCQHDTFNNTAIANGTDDKSFTFDGTDMYVHTVNQMHEFNDGIDNKNMTMCGWFNTSNTPLVNQQLMGMFTRAGGSWMGFQIDSYGTDFYTIKYSFFRDILSDKAHNESVKFVCARLNQSHTSIWVDGEQSNAHTDAMDKDTDCKLFHVGVLYNNDGCSIQGSYASGSIDDISVWNDSLTDTEILDLFNTGITTTAGDTISPSITITSPANNSLLTEDVYINITIDEDGVCSVNNSLWSLQSSTSINFSFLETTAPSDNYNILVECNDTALNYASSVLNFTKLQPQVIIISPEDSATVNADIFNITFQFANFNPNICQVYHNFSEDGEFIAGQNISETAYNESSFYNDTVIILNTTDTNAIYRFEENGGSTAIDLSQGNNGSIVGALYTPSKITNATGNFSLNFTSDYIQVPYSSYMSFGTLNDFTISAWVQADIIDSNYHMIIDTRDGSSDGVFLSIASGDIIQLAVNSLSMSSSTTISDNDWHFIVATVDRNNAGNTDIYIDNNPEGVGIATNTQNVATTSDAYIGRRSFSAGIYWGGRLDEIYIFNKYLTPSQITELYHDGLERLNITLIENITTIESGDLNESTNLTIGVDIEDEGIFDLLYFINCKNGDDVNSTIQLVTFDNDFTPPVIDILFPENNATYNIDMNINWTTDEITVCTVNDSAFILDTQNTTFYNYAEDTLDNDFYSINITCLDPSDNVAHETINFTKDKEFPLIEYINPQTDIVSFFPSLSTLYLKINVTDNRDLFNFYTNLTYYDENIEEWILLFEDELNISGTFYKYIQPVVMTDFPNNTLIHSNTRTCDSHTKNKIKPADDIEKLKSSIKFRFGDTQIKIKSLNGNTIATDTNKYYDRYDFTFMYDENVGIKEYELSCNKPLTYITPERAGYKGHFVCGNRWIDFEQDGEVDIEESNATGKYIIYVDNPEPTVTFNSVGELNCNTESVSFQLIVEEEEGVTLLNFNVSTTANVLILFTLLILYLGLMLLGFHFKNFGFASFGFVVGIMLGILLHTVHIVLTIAFFLLNISIFIRYALNFK